MKRPTRERLTKLRTITIFHDEGQELLAEIDALQSELDTYKKTVTDKVG